MPFFGRFTERAQRAINDAQRLAIELGHSYVGTEHVLFGLLTESDSLPPERRPS